MYEKEKLFKKYVNKKTQTAKVKYNKARNLYCHTIQQKKKLHYSSLFDKQKIISKMQPKNSTGIDKIPISLVKSSSDYILFGLCHFFNLSLSQGQFITDFRKAKVIPVHKKGQKTNVNNYRLISLLPVLSKILEKIVHNRMYSFLSQSNFFYNLHFGFRKNHSTSHAAAVVVENITKSFEDKEYTLGVFLDLFKAFDTIDHSILLAKLNHFGVEG